MSFTRSSFWLGLKNALPVTLGIIPFGLITGVSAVTVGLSYGEAIAMSAIVFAGSAQLASLQLMDAHASIAVILITTFFINLRFTMYSASLAPYTQSYQKRWRLLIAYFMTDQAFAFTIEQFTRHPEKDNRFYYAGVGFSIWLAWIISTIVGAVLGAQIPKSWSLDFAIPLTFIALLVPALKTSASMIAALTGGIIAVVFAGLPYNAGLIVAALSGISAGMIMQTLQARKQPA